MGLISRDDGWRMPDWLWERIEPLLPAPPFHPLGYPPPAGAGSRRDGRDPAGAADGDAVERAERDGNLLVELGAPALSGVGAGRGVPRDLAAGAVGVRQGGRDRLGVAGR